MMLACEEGISYSFIGASLVLHYRAHFFVVKKKGGEFFLGSSDFVKSPAVVINKISCMREAKHNLESVGWQSRTGALTCKCFLLDISFMPSQCLCCHS